MNPRAEYLKTEFERCITVLRQKLEQGMAAGGMTLKPYPKDGHIYFDWTMDWSLYPIAFDDDGNLSDVIFRDTYTEGKTIYTRLERHVVEGENVKITHRAFKSTVKDAIGVEISLSDVPMWAELKPEATVTKTDGQMFGWYKVAAANTVNAENKTMTGYCYVRDAWFVPQSTGGDTSGYAIPYNIHPVGPMVKKNISYSMETNTATITDISA